MPKSERLDDITGGVSSALEEAAVSCWRRVSCVGGGIECPLEDAVASCWTRVSCVGGGTSGLLDPWRRHRVSIGGSGNFVLEACLVRWRRYQ